MARMMPLAMADWVTFSTNGTSGIGAWKNAIVAQATRDATIVKVHFAMTTSDGTLATTASIRQVSSGIPSSSLWDTDTQGTVTGQASGWNEIELTAPAILSAGDIFAIGIEYNQLGFAANTFVTSYVASATGKFPFSILRNGSWGDVSIYLSDNYSFVAELDDGGFLFLPYICPLVPSTVALTASSSPDEVGNLFSVGAPLRIAGAIIPVKDAPTAAEVRLYDANDNIIASVDVSAMRATGTVSRGARLFPSPVDLVPGELYRLTLLGGGASVDVTKMTGPSEAFKDAVGLLLPGNVWTEREDEGSWTDAAASQALIIPLVYSDWAGANGGGLDGPRSWVG